MKVYNLTEMTLDYRGYKIPPNGGWVEIPDLTFIPDRDKRLEKEKYLSFGSLPSWWHPPNLIPVEKKSSKELTETPKVEDSIEIKPTSKKFKKE